MINYGYILVIMYLRSLAHTHTHTIISCGSQLLDPDYSKSSLSFGSAMDSIYIKMSVFQNASGYILTSLAHHYPAAPGFKATFPYRFAQKHSAGDPRAGT